MKKNVILGCTLSMLLAVQPLMAQNEIVSLNSDKVTWTLRAQSDIPDVRGESLSTIGYDMGATVQGVVPGTVFTAYVEAGLVENPDYADNIYRVDESQFNKPYWYRAEFDTPASYSEGRRVWLCFDNTNRYADFYFNGVKISGTPESTKDVSGHMMRTKLDVTHLVKLSGKNAVAVLITDCDQKKSRKGKDPYGVACSPSYLAGAGWDWMPYVPGRLAGITGKAYLEVTGDVVMDDPWVRSDLRSLNSADVQAIIDLKNVSDERKEVEISGVINPGNITFSRKVWVKGNSVENVIFDHGSVKEMIIDNPKLWWPNGYGDPNLYTCSLTCKVDGKVSQEKEITFGLRKYEYRLEYNKVGYPVFTFYINGQKIYVKGGNWGMSEYLLRCHGEEYEKKIKLHRDMNYNMIRLWTGCVTDDEFYDYCDRYGIMVWDDFWLYVAYNDVAEPEAFKANARDKVRRLRNHACIALWCGANETHPKPELDNYLRAMVAMEDRNDRMYKSCSNQDALSGSGWWQNQPPRHHFDTSGSNLAFNKPAYPYGNDYGYGMRSEIGTATFPTYESVKLFIPKNDLWPLPTVEQLKEDDNTVWNKHFFGKEAWNANPVKYMESVNMQFGESSGIEEFCEKAQILNIEVMKGMYEAWNDKMWHDAAGILIWMSHPAYPSFVWQTYDYYYDPTGAYWGAKKACEHRHIQWNASTNSIKVVNTTREPIEGAVARVRFYNLDGTEVTSLAQQATVSVPASDVREAFVLKFGDELTPMHFFRLELLDAAGNLISDNFYWRNGEKELDYTPLNDLKEVKLTCELADGGIADGKMTLRLTNNSATVAFANRLRLVNSKTGERVLPVIMNDNYVTLMPGQSFDYTVDACPSMLASGVDVLVKQYGHKEKRVLKIK